MNDNFALQLPFNSTSFGNIGFSIAREIMSRGINPCIFPIGPVDFSSQKPDDKLAKFLQDNINKSLKTHSKKNPCIRLWHTNQDSISSVSNEEIFITFIETDQITEYERNILNQKKTVFVTSNFLKGACNDYGLTNVKYLQLGFDGHNFNKLDKKFWNDDRIVFNLLGKYEHRKHHKKVIRAWLKKYGVPKTGVIPKYTLQCAIYNPFLVQNINGQIIDHNINIFRDCTEGKDYGNIQFLGWMQNNLQYNDYLQSAHAVLGLGGGENFGAGEFHSVALGKHSVILNANGFKDWADPNNSCLVQPNSKVECYDGVFFQKGNIFQQGNFYSYSDDEFIDQFEKVVKRIKDNPLNTKGLELQNRTYKETVDNILKEIDG